MTTDTAAHLAPILVVGAGGQLGHDLLRALHGAPATGLTRADLDVTDADSVRAAVRAYAGNGVVINASAWTDVDGAETAEEAAYAVNATGPRLLAEACAQAGARLVHVSTDYVFAGDAESPYDVDAPTAPSGAYGRTKLAGEQAVAAALAEHYVVRTAWVYGASGRNFVKTMVKLERERETLNVVDDQRGSPTWSWHLAQALVALARSRAPYRTYHVTNGGDTTWCGFARAIFEEAGADPERVHPCTTADFPRPAPRPAYSVLSDRAWREAGFDPLPHWRDALREAFGTASFDAEAP